VFAQSATPEQIRTAAAKSLVLLQKASDGFTKAQDCYSCHHTGLPANAVALARERGVAVNEGALRASAVKSLTRGRDLTSVDRSVQANMIIDPASSEAAGLILAHDAGVRPSLTTAIQARLIANAQRADGHWLTIDARPPQGHSQFTATATAIRAVQLYMPEELRKETEERTARTKAWFTQAKPLTTEDFTYRLIGLAWTGASDVERAGAVRELRALQRPNGGWAQLPRMEPDAYATGEALVALEAGGVPVTDSAWRKGLQFLMSTQKPDGSWMVKSRMVSPAQVSPPYFETGFPGGHDQFISSAGTAYATMALLLTLPKTKGAAAPTGIAELEPRGVKPWMRTVVFGTAAELKALLDKGLDAKAKTEDGTTLVMLAAPDAAKIKLLVERGADVNAKAKTGYTALMVASLYRGSGDAVRYLLSKGASAAAGTGVMFNASALFLATYAGEPGNIALLKAKGADVNRKMMLIGTFPWSPLMAAVNFGEVEVMKTLIAAGSDLKEHDPDGLGLLHSAVLANKVEAAQALISAGAALNDADKHGYTPLLYASTVDFGDDRMVNLLLKAGADAKVKSKAGETALAQAKRFKYTHIQAALEKGGAKE